MKKLLLIFPVMLLLSGCLVPNKQYRKVPASLIRAETLPDPSSAGKCDPAPGNPCMVFLEFDEFGEMWEPAQLDTATDLIKHAVTPGKHPVVVTFFHGWKNNDDPKRDQRHDGNAFGFSKTLMVLAGIYKNTPVIGVYVSWRGELVSKYWPVRRQFSYFNREEAAIRIPGARMTNALAHVVRATHDVDGFAVLVGHSFGGLVMERALTQATINQLQQSPDPCSEKEASEKGSKSVPDLAVFVNSAAAATEGKQLLDVLKDYRPCNSTGSGPRSPDTALFISIASVSDSAVKLALPIGHGIPFLRYKFKGSLRSEDPLAHCAPPSPDPNCPKTPSQGSFYLSSAAHMEILQSHQVVSATAKECTDAGNVWPYFSLPDTKECYRIEEKKNAWNDTPYWLMEVPSEIIPDHSTIFTGRFIAMLKSLVPTNDQMEGAQHPKMLKLR
jgi:hypothetical protein